MCDMWNDPIIEEIHRVRKQLLARAKGSLRSAIDSAARRQKSSGRIVLAAAPRKPAKIPRTAAKSKARA